MSTILAWWDLYVQVPEEHVDGSFCRQDIIWVIERVDNTEEFQSET